MVLANVYLTEVEFAFIHADVLVNTYLRSVPEQSSRGQCSFIVSILAETGVVQRRALPFFAWSLLQSVGLTDLQLQSDAKGLTPPSCCC